MKFKALLALALSCVCCFASPKDDRVVVAYFAEWGIYGRNYHVSEIPAENLTHVIYAFAKISSEGEVTMFDPFAAVEKSYPGDSWDESIRGNFKQLQLLKAKYPHLKTLIAIGGWTLSDPFSQMASTPSSRQKFISSAIDFMQTYGFDGIDIDWEYPVNGGLANGHPNDKQNFTLLMQELRAALDLLEKENGCHYLLTVASAAGDAMENYELDKLSPYIDWFNLMTYDYHGAWENQTNHHSPLYPSPEDPSAQRGRFCIDYSVNTYLNSGISPKKIVLGLPLYSRAWAGVNGQNGGLYQNATHSAKGTWEPGILDYADLYLKIQNAPDQFVHYEDTQAGAAWVFNPYLDQGTFYTYDSPNVVDKKLQYIEEKGLRGAMFWELSGDLREKHHPDSLIEMTARKLLSA